MLARLVMPLLLASGAFLASSLASMAGEKFSTAALEAAQNAGKPVLVEVTALWCPTCQAQKPILSELTKQAKFKNLVVLEVDFDTQKEALRALNARSQSTLIVFKGKAETGRSVGDTNKASIAALLDKAV